MTTGSPGDSISHYLHTYLQPNLSSLQRAQEWHFKQIPMHQRKVLVKKLNTSVCGTVFKVSSRELHYCPSAFSFSQRPTLNMLFLRGIIKLCENNVNELEEHQYKYTSFGGGKRAVNIRDTSDNINRQSLISCTNKLYKLCINKLPCPPECQ